MAHESRCARCQVDSLITVIVDGIAALFRRDARVEKAALCKADRAAKGVAGGIASAWTGPLTLLNGLHLAIAAVFKLAGGTTAIAVLGVGIVALLGTCEDHAIAAARNRAAHAGVIIRVIAVVARFLGAEDTIATARRHLAQAFGPLAGIARVGSASKLWCAASHQQSCREQSENGRSRHAALF
jgi:hypothetical protein